MGLSLTTSSFSGLTTIIEIAAPCAVKIRGGCNYI